MFLPYSWTRESIVAEDLEVSKEKWQRWLRELTEGDECVIKKLQKAAELCETLRGMQTEAKWGREEGPVAFQRVYASYWQQEKTALEGMIENVDKFAKAVKKALKNLEAGDKDAATKLNQEVAGIPSMYISEEKRRLLDSEFGALPRGPSRTGPRPVNHSMDGRTVMAVVTRRLGAWVACALVAVACLCVGSVPARADDTPVRIASATPTAPEPGTLMPGVEITMDIRIWYGLDGSDTDTLNTVEVTIMLSLGELGQHFQVEDCQAIADTFWSGSHPDFKSKAFLSPVSCVLEAANYSQAP